MDVTKLHPRARRQALFLGVFLVVVVLFVVTYCMGVVRGMSMDPTYQDGQIVLVRRRTLLNQKLHRDDVVLLQRDRGEVIIKRIYRLPGEEVSIGYSNLATPLLRDFYEQESVKVDGETQIRYVVPQGYVVVLGDNPDVSEDSRFFGPVPISSIIGTVVDAPPPPPTTLQRRAPLNPATTF